jgi:hypothetical protein
MKRLLATASGLCVGGFLFHRFGFDNHRLLYGWQWYQGAVVLAAIGLGGVFPEAWLSAAIALAIAPSLVFCYEIVYLHPAESLWPVVLPLVFLLSFPAPLIGSSIAKLLLRRLPGAVYLVVLTGALMIGVLLPNFENLWLRRVETVTVPRLLKQIYEAEMVYSARQPEGNFICDGTLLPGAAGKLGWHPGDSSMITYLVVDFYRISLNCPNEINPRSFRLTADSNEGYIPAPRLSMDMNGNLIVTPAPLEELKLHH